MIYWLGPIQLGQWRGKPRPAWNVLNLPMAATPLPEPFQDPFVGWPHLL